MWCFGDGMELIGFAGKYVVLSILKPREWAWDWRIIVPVYQNWFRLEVFLPFGAFAINGWLAWGKRPCRAG